MQKTEYFSFYFLLCFFLLCLSANVFANDDIIDEEYFLLELEDCDGTADLCLDIPLGESPFYTFMVDGAPYMGMISGCNFDTTFAYSYANLTGEGNLGPYMLESWVVNGEVFSGQFQNMPELVDMMNNWDPTGFWELNTMNKLIVGGDPSNNYSVMNVTTIIINSPDVIGFNLGLEPKGSLFSFPEGVHQVVITNTLNGCTDAFEVEVICVESAFVSYDIEIGETGMHCFDFSDLPGNIQSVNNITAPDTDPVVEYAFVNGNTCLEFTGLAAGADTVCIVLCDDLNWCDTTKVAVSVAPPMIQYMEVDIDLPVYEVSEYCFNVFEQLPGDLSFTNLICEGDENNVVFGFIDQSSFCMSLEAVKIGKDRVCYQFGDNQSNILEIVLNVNVLAPVPEVIEVELELGEFYESCLDISEIFGRPEDITNICPENSGNSVFFSINPLSLCLEVESINPGFESICIEFCDEKGVCDNVEYRISVIDNTNGFPPIASDDQINIPINESITIDICENDDWNAEELTDFSLMSIQEGGSGPYHGSVSLNANCQITYQPNDDYCGDDSFTYIICNENGCDAAIVTIDVACPPEVEEEEEFFVFTGFSPNGDGLNDTFKITGLKNYPGSKLSVYNRWGVLVFEKIDYSGDWNGIWNGKILADGTYYYVIELRPGHKEMGYLQINR